MRKQSKTRIPDSTCFDIALDSVLHGCNSKRQSELFDWSRPTIMKLKREPRYLQAVEKIREKAFDNFLNGVE